MKNFLLILVLINLFTLPCLSQVKYDLSEKILSEYVGEWTNVDQKSRSITKVIITNDGDLTIQAFGKCHPNDCDWGTTKLHLVASMDGDSYNNPFDFCFATWENDAANYSMRLNVGSGPNPKLHIESVTIFKDNSGRRNYHLDLLMEKKPGS